MPDQSTRKRRAPRPNVACICANCGASFVMTASQAERSIQHYCSLKCFYVGHEHMPHAFSPTTDVSTRFWPKVDVSNDKDACWLWLGSRVPDGYGTVFYKGKNVKAHRVAWELVADTIPNGMHVLHTCDNPACVRNDDEGWYEVSGVLHPRRGHLWLGTHEDNMQDKKIKGRAPGTPGGAHPLAKLTPDIVQDLRRRYMLGDSTKAIADEYGMSRSAIYRAISGKRWKSV